MNSEESRLRTFSNWPENAPVDPKKVAKAGFYYTGRGLEVQCFSCGSRVRDWNYGDQVMARHKALDPRCPFVLNLRDSGNVPLRNAQSTSATERRQDEESSNATPDDLELNPVRFQDEGSRLSSYHDWPIPSVVSPSRLAAAGFFYTHRHTEVMCAFCKGVISQWEADFDPELIHGRFYPTCKYIVDRLKYRSEPYRNITVRGFGEIAESEEIEALRALGVFYHRIPKNPKYATVEARLRTYSRWSSLFNQRPEVLADAGFYYTGVGDKVRCFHCDGGLKDWKKNDDPWLEHARWFSDCIYLVMIKGTDFVHEALITIPQSLRIGETPVQTPQIHEVSEETLQSHMSSSAAITALEMGIEASRVKCALRHRLRATGRPYEEDETHLLISFCMDIQSEEGNLGFDGESSLGPPLCSRRVLEVRDHVSPDDSEESEMEDSSAEASSVPVNRNVIAVAYESLKKPNGDSKMETPKNDTTLEEENRLLKEARLCKVCLDREVVIVFLPCAHLVTCSECAQNLKDCPLCRQAIRATVRTYLS